MQGQLGLLYCTLIWRVVYNTVQDVQYRSAHCVLEGQVQYTLFSDYLL